MVHRKTDVVLVSLEDTVSSEAAVRRRRSQERITALSAEEMLLVIRPFPELRVVECDEQLVDDGGLTVVAARREFLLRRRKVRQTNTSR